MEAQAPNAVTQGDVSISGAHGADDQEQDAVAALKKMSLKDMMKSDPKFIGRLIQQLDKQMHGMDEEKKRRVAKIEADKAEIARIDAEIETHIQPRMSALLENLAAKEALRDNLKQQLDQQTSNFTSVERQARQLLQKASHAGRSVTRESVSNMLLETRGYSATIPTTQLISKGSKKGSSPASTAAATQ